MNVNASTRCIHIIYYYVHITSIFLLYHIDIIIILCYAIIGKNKPKRKQPPMAVGSAVYYYVYEGKTKLHNIIYYLFTFAPFPQAKTMSDKCDALSAIVEKCINDSCFINTDQY